MVERLWLPRAYINARPGSRIKPPVLRLKGPLLCVLGYTGSWDSRENLWMCILSKVSRGTLLRTLSSAVLAIAAFSTMKKRREINRKRRNATDGRERERLWRLYPRQKMVIQRQIREARERHEIELTKEIRRKMKEGRGGKRLWECMGRIWEGDCCTWLTAYFFRRERR